MEVDKGIRTVERLLGDFKRLGVSRAEPVLVAGGGDDPLPFLLVPHLHIPSLLVANLIAGRDWIRIDFNIGKLVEPAGD